MMETKGSNNPMEEKKNIEWNHIGIKHHNQPYSPASTRSHQIGSIITKSKTKGLNSSALISNARRKKEKQIRSRAAAAALVVVDDEKKNVCAWYNRRRPHLGSKDFRTTFNCSVRIVYYWIQVRKNQWVIKEKLYLNSTNAHSGRGSEASERSNNN